MKINLDEHGLLDLIWVAVNGSHLKNEYFLDAVRWWEELDMHERFFLWHYSIRNHMESMTSEKYPHVGREYYLRFLARYDPRNQYKVTMDDGKGHKNEYKAYKFHKLYYIDDRSFCEPKYIAKVEHDENVWPYYYEHYHHNYRREVEPYLGELDKEIEKEVTFGEL